MASDSTSLKAQIDAALGGKGYRGVTVGAIVTIMKTVADWVRDSINANLTTWLKLGDGQPGGANTDAIYRTGETYFKGPARFYTGTTNAAPLAGLVIGSVTGLQLTGNNGGPAFMEFHLPGQLIHQLGVDVDGTLKLHPWATAQAYALLIDGITRQFGLTDDLLNRKIVLYGNVNDHQFFGFGINSNVLRYQIGGAGANHVFYAGASPATSLELMRITGDGRVGIGIAPAGNTALDVSGGWASFHGNMAGRSPGNGIGVSLGWNYSGGQAESNIVYGVQDWPTAFLNFCSWNGLVMSEKMRLDINGNLGINTTAPTSILHLKAAAGFPERQLRLETKFTPSGTGDARGNVGDVAWDDNFSYIKTAAGWKRSALTTW